MVRRGIVFRGFLIVVAIVVTIPGIYIAGHDHWPDLFDSGDFSLRLPGFNGTTYGSSDLDGATFVRNRFYSAIVQSRVVIKNDLLDTSQSNDQIVGFQTTDPETGETLRTLWPNQILLNYADSISSRPTFVGDESHLWMVDHQGCVYDVTSDGHLELPLMPPNAIVEDFKRIPFVVSGRLNCLAETKSGMREILRLENDGWHSQGVFESPNTPKNSQKPVQITLGPSLLSPFASQTFTLILLNNYKFRLLPIDGTIHQFQEAPQQLLYRPLLELQPVDENQIETADNGKETLKEVGTSEPNDVSPIPAGWIPIGDEISSTTQSFPMAVGGKPAVVLVDVSGTGYSHARALRFENERWVEFAECELPFASTKFQVGTRGDGHASYLVATTGMSSTRIFAIEPDGFRMTHYNERKISGIVAECKGLFELTIALTSSLVAGAILAAITAAMMYRDPARFEFGHTSVKLASVVRRACARSVDMFVVLITTAGLFAGLSFVLAEDWYATFEALNLQQFEHPAVTSMVRILFACLLWMISISVAIIGIQGRSGLTPGKWMFGLRVVRTTLRPCGFARSLLRELLVYLDGVSLMSWAPGILCMAFTQLRQRIGDLVADTLVIEAKSLKSHDTKVIVV